MIMFMYSYMKNMISYRYVEHELVHDKHELVHDKHEHEHKQSHVHLYFHSYAE
jgi:hypothetical protein